MIKSCQGYKMRHKTRQWVGSWVLDDVRDTYQKRFWWIIFGHEVQEGSTGGGARSEFEGCWPGKRGLAFRLAWLLCGLIAPVLSWLTISRPRNVI